MDYLLAIVDDFEERVNDIVASGEINKEIVKIAQKNLEFIKAQLEQSGKNQGILRTVNRQIGMFDQVAELPELKMRYPLVKEQVIVSLVGTTESFIGDVFRRVADNAPHILVWSKPNERISFDPLLLSRTTFSIGDAVLWHIKSKYTFQDLKSSLDALSEYLDVKIDLTNEMKHVLILAAAYRHVIVHNKSVVDEKFLSQVRETVHSGRYKVGEGVKIDDEFIEELRVTILEFMALIIIEITSKIDPDGEL